LFVTLDVFVTVRYQQKGSDMAEDFTFDSGGETFGFSPQDMLTDIADLRGQLEAAIPALESAVDSQRDQYRIEALRAASRIVAGMLTAPDTGCMARPEDTAMFFAEQFAKWLETGER
jgi:hypothetical protein